MEAVLLILVVFFVAFVALGAYATVKAVGAAKRGVDRTLSQARRTVEDTTLRAKSLGQLGVPGELAHLRLRLRTSMRATQDALQASAGDDASLSETIGLFKRLSAHGHDLDDELRMLERDPDRARVAQRLPELRERTEQIVGSADSLRWAARDRARRFAEDDLSSLSAQIDVESGALRHWTTAEEPARGPGVPDGSGGAGSGVPGAAGTHPTVVDQTWPEPPPAEGAQSIESADPRRLTKYPWQKQARSARPETTN